MYVNKNSNIPVYLQLKRIILDKIKSGEYIPDAPIPSEREIGESIQVSRMTVRQALNQLVMEGVLYREKGRGTFVLPPKFEQRYNMSFTEMVRSRGMVPSTKILDFKREIPGENVKTMLDISEEDYVYAIKRLRLANDKPIGIEKEFIPVKYCLGLEKFDLTGSFYELLRDEFSYVISGVDSTIEASKPRKEERQILGITAETPVLIVSGAYHTNSEQILYYEKSVFRSDEFKYSNKIVY